MVKINLNKELGIKAPFDIKRTNKRVEGAYSFQLENARFELAMEDVSKKVKALDPNVKTSDEEDAALNAEMINAYEKQRDHIRGLISYISDTLKLTKKQSEIMDDMETDATAELANKIASIVMGLDPDEIDKEPVPEA